jgi:hypothetical protein
MTPRNFDPGCPHKSPRKTEPAVAEIWGSLTPQRTLENDGKLWNMMENDGQLWK